MNPGVEHEAQRADPVRLEVASRVASIRIGVGLTLIVLMGAALYTVLTPSEANRALIQALLLFAAFTTMIVDHLPGERIVRSRWCEHFFVAWAVLYLVLIALICLADGGTTSAFAMLFVLPLMFSALSYPPSATAIVGAADVMIFGTVALVSGDGMAYGGFGAFALACAGVLSIWESSNQRQRRETLADTAQALSSTEASIRVQADKQEEIARFGQRALETAEVDELLDEAVQIIERVLEADLAGVLELLEEGEELLLRAGVGFESDEIGTAQVPIGRASQAGYAVTVSQPVIVEDWRDEKRFRSALQLRARGIRSGVTVLIKGKGEAFGVLAVHSKVPGHFNAQDVSFMQSIAHVLANAIERRKAEETTRHAAMHDPLTGLANRSLFLDRLGHALSQAERRRCSVAVLFLDVDQFKLVNDSMGHAAGDELLAAIAPRLSQSLRPSDTIARFGGDEFAVLIEDLSNERDATRTAERIAEVLTWPFVLGERDHFVSVSTGIAIGDGSEAPEALLRDADAALYRAKEKGRGGYEIFDQVMRARVIEHVRIENDLRLAIEREELELHYQPVVSLSDGTIRSFEALVRWRHPERGLIGPAGFIGVAEDTRLIVPIGRWVLETACREAATWQAAQPDSRPVGVAVNVSAAQLADPELPRIVEQIIARSGIHPSTLSVELTESVLLEEFGAPERILRSLKELGVGLALDDFGIGFSSLGYLKRLPLDAIKLDRTFIENVQAGTTDAVIVKAMSDMAGALDLEVVAEGVETEEQLDVVTRLGCDQAQGYFFTPPVERRVVDDLLQGPQWGAATAGIDRETA